LTVPLPEALAAICSVLLLDYFVDSSVSYMTPSEGIALPPTEEEVLKELKATIQGQVQVNICPLERFLFKMKNRRGLFLETPF
jgi:L-fucose mutarotase/ribose pyranase (RbsD/FucU family)